MNTAKLLPRPEQSGLCSFFLYYCMVYHDEDGWDRQKKGGEGELQFLRVCKSEAISAEVVFSDVEPVIYKPHMLA